MENGRFAGASLAGAAGGSRKPGGGWEVGRHPPERWRRRCLVADGATLAGASLAGAAGGTQKKQQEDVLSGSDPKPEIIDPES